MKEVKSSAKLISVPVMPEELIERAGRLCYKSEKRSPYPGSPPSIASPQAVYSQMGFADYTKKYAAAKEETRTFIKGLIKNGHESVIEHASATFLITCSRACSHQIVRHRLASYSQRSQRYVEEEDFDYVVPPSLEGVRAYERMMKEAALNYSTLVSEDLYDITKEDARFVLPNACVTQLYMTANFREWRHFIKLRGSKKAQWEIREIANQILSQLHSVAPSVFEDLKGEE